MDTLIDRFLTIRAYMDEQDIQTAESIITAYENNKELQGHQHELMCLLDNYELIERFVNHHYRIQRSLNVFNPVDFNSVKHFFRSL